MNIKYYLQSKHDDGIICEDCPFKNWKVIDCKNDCHNISDIFSDYYTIQIDNVIKYVIRYKE